jgi:Gluconate 2-dehydrogenase subunit 3
MSPVTGPDASGAGAGGPRRRSVIAVAPAALASAAVLSSSGCTSSSTSSGPRVLRFFTDHEAAVIEDATARIAPGPADDPAEAGHPGAREAGVTDYIDRMLGTLSVLGASGASGVSGGAPPPVFAGGPWSNRHTSGPDLMASFIGLDPVRTIAWRRRLGGWQQQYRDGIAALDKHAGGDFTKASPAAQDQILARADVGPFRALLFEHTIEGLYCAPEYGGNRDLVGWKDISYPGDVQPRGYTAKETSRSDGPDPLDQTPVVAEVLKFLGVV